MALLQWAHVAYLVLLSGLVPVDRAAGRRGPVTS